MHSTFGRRHDLWHQPCFNSNPRTGSNLEGFEPYRDGALGPWLNGVPRYRPRHTPR